MGDGMKEECREQGELSQHKRLWLLLKSSQCKFSSTLYYNELLRSYEDEARKKKENFHKNPATRS